MSAGKLSVLQSILRARQQCVEVWIKNLTGDQIREVIHAYEESIDADPGDPYDAQMNAKAALLRLARGE